MKNLAGHKNSNQFILKELEIAGLKPINCKPEGEVKSENYSILKTKFGEIKFDRAWSYWIVTGLIPLNIAEKIYENKIGRKDIRVTGHCEKPHPKDWINYYTKEGKEVILQEEFNKFKKASKSLWENRKDTFFNDYEVKDSYENSIPCIDLYHIDSQEGLDLFVKIIKEENLCL